MFGVARVGDKTVGKCHCHIVTIDVEGTIITGSPDRILDGRPVARLGDIIKADCGHTCKIITASSSVITNGRGTARLGDKGGDDCYECTIVTASTDDFIL